MFPENNIHPILFEECYVKGQSANMAAQGPRYGVSNMIEDYPVLNPGACDDYEGVHLFILVHGF